MQRTSPVRVAKICAVPLSVKALLRPQIDALSAAGYQVITVCSDGPDVAVLRSQGLDIHTVEIPRRIAPLADLKAIWQLARVFRRERIQVVHTHTPKAAFLGQVAAWLTRVPVRVNTVHGLYYLALSPGMGQRLFKRLEITTCRLAHYVFSQSAEDIDLIRRDHLVREDKLEWLGNGISVAKFSRTAFPPEQGACVRMELQIPADAFVVGIVARMVTEKGLGELFKAFAQVRAHAPNAYLLHIGPVDRSRNDEVTPEWAQRYGIAEFCRFTGERNDVARLMTAMDIYCLPSYREGYPRSVMEANAMGLPAIVTDIRGCREAVISESNGLLVPPREVAPLAEAILRLYRDVELRQRLAVGARQRAERAFDERVVIRKVLDAYGRLLARKL